MRSRTSSGEMASSQVGTGKNGNENGNVPASRILRKQELSAGTLSKTEEAVRHELMERITELKIENGRLRCDLSEARLEAKMAPMPASYNRYLRQCLAGVCWADSLEEAKRIAEEGLRSGPSKKGT